MKDSITFEVDLWLRGENHATTQVIAPVAREPQAWSDADVAAVLEAMLRALERASRPGGVPDRPVALRGFSWIVTPYATGGVVIALELTLGAAVAGPFDVSEAQLSATIARVLETQRTVSPTVH